MLVHDYMTADPVVVNCNEPVDRISLTMRRLAIHQVPVVDESGRLVGIVSDRDIRSAIGYGERNAELNLVAEDVMVPDVVSVSPSTELIQVVQILRQRRFGGVPVTEDGEVVGIITKHDLLRRLYEILRNWGDAEPVLSDRTAVVQHS
ncbi:MAG: HPP family protein [Phycisphaerae bacterium]